MKKKTHTPEQIIRKLRKVEALRDELLDRELFSTLYEAEVLVEQFRVRYHTHRPHSSLNY